MIYLDNAATTKISPSVLKAMIPYLNDSYGNAGSLHSKGREAYEAVEKARKQVADFIGASPEQIIFTSGGTEGNNMVIRNATQYMKKTYNKYRLVTSAVEHDSILNTANKLPRSFKLDEFPVDESGAVNLNELAKHIVAHKDAVSLVSIMRTNNELGSINDVENIGEICSELGVSFHTDCVQSAGFSPINVDKFQCNFLTLSSHKIHGPKGVGALYVRKPEEFHPLIYGGEHQEFGLRGGTENVAGIVGFGKACEDANENLSANSFAISFARGIFCGKLVEQMEQFGLEPFMHFNSAEGKIVNVRFDGIRSESLLMMLDSKGVCVSAGSACNASDGKPSHVLKAIGLTDEQARCSIRVSFSWMNSIDEAALAATIIASCVKILHEM